MIAMVFVGHCDGCGKSLDGVHASKANANQVAARLGWSSPGERASLRRCRVGQVARVHGQEAGLRVAARIDCARIIPPLEDEDEPNLCAVCTAADTTRVVAVQP